MSIVEAAAETARLAWLVDLNALPDPQFARLLARFGEVIDIGAGVEAAIARLRDQACSGVLFFTDRWQLIAASVATDLGLRGHSHSSALALHDKFEQRSRLFEAGVECPAFMAIDTATDAEIERAAQEIGWPAVLKPRVGAGSRNLRRINSEQALRESLASSPGHYLLESYLPSRPDGRPDCDDVLSVESIVVDGVVRHLVVTGRFRFDSQLRDTGGFMPSQLDEAEQAACRAAAGRAIAALDLHDGVCHTEIKLTPAGPRIIEINGRVGGHVPQLLNLIGGPPLINWAMRIALGSGAELPDIATDGVAFFWCEQPPVSARGIKAVSGLDDVRQLPGVTGVNLQRGPGSEVDWREGVDGWVWSAEGCVPDHDGLWRLRDQLSATVTVTYDEG